MSILKVRGKVKEIAGSNFYPFEFNKNSEGLTFGFNKSLYTLDTRNIEDNDTDRLDNINTLCGGCYEYGDFGNDAGIQTRTYVKFDKAKLDNLIQLSKELYILDNLILDVEGTIKISKAFQPSATHEDLFKSAKSEEKKEDKKKAVVVHDNEKILHGEFQPTYTNVNMYDITDAKLITYHPKDDIYQFEEGTKIDEDTNTADIVKEAGKLYAVLDPEDTNFKGREDLDLSKKRLLDYNKYKKFFNRVYEDFELVIKDKNNNSVIDIKREFVRSDDSKFNLGLAVIETYAKLQKGTFQEKVKEVHLPYVDEGVKLFSIEMVTHYKITDLLGDFGRKATPFEIFFSSEDEQFITQMTEQKSYVLLRQFRTLDIVRAYERINPVDDSVEYINRYAPIIISESAFAQLMRTKELNINNVIKHDTGAKILSKSTLEDSLGDLYKNFK